MNDRNKLILLEYRVAVGWQLSSYILQSVDLAE